MFIKFLFLRPVYIFFSFFNIQMKEKRMNKLSFILKLGLTLQLICMLFPKTIKAQDHFNVESHLRAYVEAIAYEKGQTLCYSVAYAITSSLNRHSIGSPNHPFYNDLRYRNSILEWAFFLKQDAFKSALSSEDQESLTSLYVRYANYLVNSEEFKTAIKHCALENNLEPKALERNIKERILHQQKASATIGVIGALVSIEIAIEFIGGPVLRGIGRIFKWVKNRIKMDYAVRGDRLFSFYSDQAQRQAMEEQVSSKVENKNKVFNGYNKWLKRGVQGVVAISFIPTFLEIFNSIEDIYTEQPESEQSNSISFQSSWGNESMRWWTVRYAQYEDNIIEKSLSLKYLSENQLNTLEWGAAYIEYITWLDFYMIDYWIIKHQVEQARVAPETRNIKKVRMLSMALQLFDLRKKELEMELADLQNGNTINANHRREYLTVLFKLLEISQGLPYGVCNQVRSLSLCRFHMLHTKKYLGEHLTDMEHQELQQLTANLEQLLQQPFEENI